MGTDEDRCTEWAQLERIDDAFTRGDLQALRAAVEDPSVIPNGRMPDTIGPCLIYAIYHSPLAFIRELLELGADPNAPADDGFPPLIAALSCGREGPGMKPRSDLDEVIRVLLSFGADPNQRGINDYTALHMAVGEGNALAVYRLLEAGADSSLRTRIDECHTPAEMAGGLGNGDIITLFQTYPDLGRRLRSGVKLMAEITGKGDLVQRQRNYMVRLRLWLHGGDAVRWQAPSGPVGVGRLEDNGETLVTEMRINRGQMMNGLFYGIDGMRVGGTRRLEIAPHLAYGETGIPGTIPENALLIAEVTILEGR